MEKEVLAWGNSSGVRFRKEDMKERGFEKGDIIIFTITQIIKKEEENGKKRRRKK